MLWPASGSLPGMSRCQISPQDIHNLILWFILYSLCPPLSLSLPPLPSPCVAFFHTGFLCSPLLLTGHIFLSWQPNDCKGITVVLLREKSCLLDNDPGSSLRLQVVQSQSSRPIFALSFLYLKDTYTAQLWWVLCDKTDLFTLLNKKTLKLQTRVRITLSYWHFLFFFPKKIY